MDAEPISEQARQTNPTIDPRPGLSQVRTSCFSMALADWADQRTLPEDQPEEPVA
jgi:hypothetical protein